MTQLSHSTLIPIYFHMLVDFILVLIWIKYLPMGDKKATINNLYILKILNMLLLIMKWAISLQHVEYILLDPFLNFSEVNRLLNYILWLDCLDCIVKDSWTYMYATRGLTMTYIPVILRNIRCTIKLSVQAFIFT